MIHVVKFALISATLVGFLFISCETHRIGNDSLVKTSDGKGNLQSEINYVDDTIKHGVAKFYYYPHPANVLKDEIEYKSGVKDGWHTHYREDGTMESKINFKNGLQDGLTYWYYENENLKEESFWVKGKSYGIGKWYFPSGNLQTFNVTDYYGEVLYIIQYDEKGTIVSEDGVVFSPNFIATYADDTLGTPVVENSVKTEEEILIKVTVAEPPNTRTSIRMGIYPDLQTLPIEHSTATFRKTFTKEGEFVLVTIGQIVDADGEIVRRDSISTKIVVKE